MGSGGPSWDTPVATTCASHAVSRGQVGVWLLDQLFGSWMNCQRPSAEPTSALPVMYIPLYGRPSSRPNSCGLLPGPRRAPEASPLGSHKDLDLDLDGWRDPTDLLDLEDLVELLHCSPPLPSNPGSRCNNSSNSHSRRSSLSFNLSRNLKGSRSCLHPLLLPPPARQRWPRAVVPSEGQGKRQRQAAVLGVEAGVFRRKAGCSPASASEAWEVAEEGEA